MIEVGQEMEWRKVVSEWGHTDCIPVKVLKVGKRITVEARLRNGGTKKAVVTAERLYPLLPPPAHADERHE